MIKTFAEIQGHAYHEECFRVVGLKCEHCYKYLDKSIDELTKSYNQRLHLEETQLELNDEEIDEDGEFNGTTVNVPLPFQTIYVSAPSTVVVPPV